MTGDSDPAYLIGLLGTAAMYAARPAADYGSFLGISAKVWQKSTELSLDAVFGNHAGIKVSPTDGYKWTPTEAHRLTHFVNCHGAAADPHFYGQSGAAFPVAHSAAWMASRVLEATVMAAECCYGAELYDPALPTAGGQMGMCNTYLGAKAYACFASTNIAYGPDATNDQADLICQKFLSETLGGASAGRACLQARLDYVSDKGGVLTPVDLKTLAQFNLMADPSLTPVAASANTTVLAKGTGARNLVAASASLARHSRLLRRAALQMQSESTGAYRLMEPKSPAGGGKTGSFGKLRKLAAEQGIKEPDVLLSYSFGPASLSSGAKGFLPSAARTGLSPIAVHAIFERRESPKGIPHLPMIRGLQAIEYPEGMVAQVFESR